MLPSSKVTTVRVRSTNTGPLYCDACLAIPAQSQWKEWADKIYLDSYQFRSTQSWWKAVPQSWTAIDIQVATLLMHKCSSHSNYRMGTTGCRIFTSQPNQQGYGNTDSCKSAHQILSPGNNKNSSKLVSWPSYGKYRTRAKVCWTLKAMWIQLV